MSDSRAVLRSRYSGAFDIAIVMLVLAWHVGGSGPVVLARLASEVHPMLHLAAWLALLIIILAGAASMRARSGPGVAWPLAGFALVTCAIVTLNCPSARILELDWAWGSTGWVGVLVLARRPLPELIAFLVAEALIVFSVLVISGPADRHDLAGYTTVLYASASIQLAVAIGARVMDVPAAQAAAQADQAAAIAARLAIAEGVSAARRARYLATRKTIEPLLTGLANGSSHPGDLFVRNRCAVEAARLRRLLAESDDASEPLVHELHACAYMAERRGVAVDIETAGVIPPLAPALRRQLTEQIISALTTARSRARITVTAEDGFVAVSLLANSTTAIPPSTKNDDVLISRQRDGENLWVEARWNR